VNELVDALPFDTLIKSTYGDPGVTLDGMRAINNFLDQHGHPMLPSGFLRVKKTRSGTFATRAADYLLKVHGRKLTSEQKSKIGQMADFYHADGEMVACDFTYDIMNWPPGSFGNPGSCYRGSYAGSVTMIKRGDSDNDHGFAMRLFKPGGDWYGAWRGYGRVWVIPVSDNRVVCFNAYGPRIEEYGMLFTNVLKELTGHSDWGFKSIDLRVSGGGMHINNSQIIIARPPIKTSSITLNIPRLQRGKCYICNKWVDDDPPDSHFNGDVFLCDDCGRACAIGKAKGNRRYMYPVTEVLRVTKDSVFNIGRQKVEVKSGQYVHNSYEKYSTQCIRCGTFCGGETPCNCAVPD